MNPFEVIKNINQKGGILPREEVANVSEFMLNYGYSNTRDTIFAANEANQFKGMPDDAVYRFYYAILPKSPKRFGTWNKMPPLTDDIEFIMELYNYNRVRAEEVYPILKDKLPELKLIYTKGGKSK